MHQIRDFEDLGSRGMGVIRWGPMLLGAILTLLCALSVHVIALNYLGVPFPSGLPSGGWSRLPDRILAVFGAFVFATLLGRARGGLGPAARIAVVFTVTAMVGEDLVRGPLMDIFPSSEWTLWPFVDMLPRWIRYLLLALAAVSVGRLPSRFLRIVAAVAVAVLLANVVGPFLRDLFDPLRAWTAAREGHGLYQPPYDWHVQVPAYITFAEPVLGALAVAALVSPELSSKPAVSFLQIAALVIAMRGQFFSTFTFPLVTDLPPVIAMLSFGQFMMESLVLSILAAATWTVSTRAR